MRFSAVFAVFLATSLIAIPTWADSFGGFSADQTSYLSGRDTICTPLAIQADMTGVPACRKAKTDQVSAMKFRRGVVQRGTRAKFSATARGTNLSLKGHATAGANAGMTATWRTTDPIARITGVHLSDGGALLAVEFEVRFGGRSRTEVVGFVLPEAGASAPDPSATATQPSQPTTAAPPVTPELKRALARARKLDKRGSAKAAIAAQRAVLALDSDHAEARYRLARGLVKARKQAEAIAELKALAASTRQDAIVWLVEARFDKRFAKLRGDSGFRAAVGFGRTGANRPLYDRLVGFSSTWEQAEIKCEQAQINLDLKRLKSTFGLRITSRCGGYKDVTRLRGRWSVSSADQVTLRLPNKGRKDDVIECAMKVCSDGSGEDCLVCGVDTDLAFTLRVVRR